MRKPFVESCIADYAVTPNNALRQSGANVRKRQRRTQRARHFRSGRCYSRYYIISFAQNKEKYEKYPYIARKRFSFSDDSERKECRTWRRGGRSAHARKRGEQNKVRHSVPYPDSFAVPYAFASGQFSHRSAYLRNGDLLPHAQSDRRADRAYSDLRIP